MLNPFLPSSPLRGGEFFGLCSNSFFIFYSVLAEKTLKTKQTETTVITTAYSKQAQHVAQKVNIFNQSVENPRSSCVIQEFLRPLHQ